MDSVKTGGGITVNATIEQVGDVIVLTPAGERLDVSTAAEFKDYIAQAVDPAARTVFDMSQLRFVDSAGLGAVVTFLKQSKNAGGNLKRQVHI
jgi:anti-sigma B factor antagonist